ncbi:putative transcription factor B3-Domain family [Helianthus annuus]|nr:putative transcription factor B3-Domain family [Helianthus annuus]
MTQKGSQRLYLVRRVYLQRLFVHPKVKSKFYVGDKGFPTKCKPKPKVSTSFTSTSHMGYRTRSKVPKLDDCMLLQEITPAEDKQAKPKCKAFRSTTSTALHVGRKCSTSKKFKKTDVIEFTKKAESRLRLPTDVSSHLCLSLDNLHHVTVQNEKCELLKLGTRREKSGKGFKYGFKKWPAFLKLNYIDFGSTLFFTYVKSSQRLMLTKVVPKITNKRCRS